MSWVRIYFTKILYYQYKLELVNTNWNILIMCINIYYLLFHLSFIHLPSIDNFFIILFVFVYNRPSHNNFVLIYST